MTANSSRFNGTVLNRLDNREVKSFGITLTAPVSIEGSTPAGRLDFTSGVTISGLNVKVPPWCRETST